MNRRKSKTTTERTLRAIRPNAGIRAWYQKQLDDALAEMHASILYWLKAEYRKTGIAQDANPATMMRDAMRKLGRRWQKYFDQMADKLAGRFVQRSLAGVDVSLRSAFNDMGMTVEFKMTDSMRTGFQAVIGEQVNLIKSIPEQYLTQVETLVMQSVQRGRDLGTLAQELEHRFGVSKRRAALIARDQNNKATAVLSSIRSRDLGITEGIWRHSHAGKHPRPEHVEADGERFDLSKGMFLEGEWVLPGEAINCRCTYSPVIPGFD